MIPFDIVKVLTAAAPIVASVSNIIRDYDDSQSTPEVEVVRVENEKQPTPVTNSINIIVTNNFYAKPDPETLKAATDSQSELLNKLGIANDKRFDL